MGARRVGGVMFGGGEVTVTGNPNLSKREGGSGRELELRRHLCFGRQWLSSGSQCDLPQGFGDRCVASCDKLAHEQPKWRV